MKSGSTGLTLLTLGLVLGLNLAHNMHHTEDVKSEPPHTSENNIETHPGETRTEFRLSIAGDLPSYRGRIAQDDMRALIAAVNEWIASHPETRVQRIVCENNPSPECLTVTLTHDRTSLQVVEVPEPQDIPPSPTGQ